MPTWAERHERFYATAQGGAVLALEAELGRRRPGLTVAGLDLDAEMLRRAPDWLRVVRGRAEELPLRPGSLNAT